MLFQLIWQWIKCEEFKKHEYLLNTRGQANLAQSGTARGVSITVAFDKLAP